MAADDPQCVEHVWRLRNVDFSLLGATEEFECTRCGEVWLTSPDVGPPPRWLSEQRPR